MKKLKPGLNNLLKSPHLVSKNITNTHVSWSKVIYLKYSLLVNMLCLKTKLNFLFRMNYRHSMVITRGAEGKAQLEEGREG